MMKRVEHMPVAIEYFRDATITILIRDSVICASVRIYARGIVSSTDIRLPIDTATLANWLSHIEDSLSSISVSEAGAAIWANLADPLGKPPTAFVQAGYDQFMETVISVGSAVFQKLSEQSEFGEFLRLLDDLPNGSRITIETDRVLIPWEILYPLPYNTQLPVPLKPTMHPEKLWGNRFLIEYLMLPANGSAWHAPWKEHLNAKTFVSLNLNPIIHEESKSCAYQPIEAHRAFYQAHLSSQNMGELRMRGDDIKTLLLSESQATIIYLYCHGRSNNPFREIGGEQLLVDKDSYIEPETLDATDNKYMNGPIIILNSCSSGAYSPLSFSTFHSRFRKKRAMGIIGTTLPMPVTFAAAFGQRLIGAYIDGNVSIGEALLMLRQELLQWWNPLGLFYILQCHLHIKAPQAREIDL